MKFNTAITGGMILGALWAQTGLRAQTPTVVHAQFSTRAVTGNAEQFLADQIRNEAGPLWVGYSVKANHKESDNNWCCDSDSRGCHLEGGHGNVYVDASKPHDPLQLEGEENVMVLFRVQDHAAQKVRPISARCPLDAGGLRFVWLTGVTPEASVAFLSGIVASSSGKSESDSALAAIAMHAGPEADAALDRFSKPAQPEWLREKALFWLASARGRRGFEAVRNAAEHDPSDSIREKTMFDFSISSDPDSIGELIHFAKADASARVRGQALFWLANKAGKKATEAIHDAVLNDPDVEVKKKAVFALQQLPKDEGVPLLIDVARHNRNPEVRKQAMFWLGQSGDPRAVAFFQEVLTGKM